MLNWARNFEYSASRIHRPETAEQVQEIVRTARWVKALGTRHSFTKIADTRGDLVSTERLNRVSGLDGAGRRVTVQAGIRYGELCTYLHSHGLALANLASLPHISVAGACATATHGSGVGNGVLAASVAGMRLVAGDGRIVSLSRQDGDEAFYGAVVNLGALGVVIEIDLDVEPAFEMTQRVYENLPFEELLSQFDEIVSAAYSVSLFTSWRGPVIDQVWVKSRLDEPEPATYAGNFFGATAATAKRSPLPDGPPENCTDQMGITGPSYDRLPHFRLRFTPSSGDELQTEYFVRREYAPEAIRRVYALRDQIAPILHISEIRSIAADRFWLSPCHMRDSIALHFTWKSQPERVEHALPQIESALADLDARPHWAKLHRTSPAQLQRLYPKLDNFRLLMQGFDPGQKFRNPYLDLFLKPGPESKMGL